MITSVRRLLLLTCLAVPLAAAPLVTWSSSAAERKGRYYAFLVACEGYSKKDFHPLHHTRNDILAFYKVLLQSGFDKSNVVLMHDNQERLLLPEAGKIQKQMKVLLKELRPEDTLVVAFSGHGVRFKGEKVTYFCPLDAQLSERKTLIGLNLIYGQLKECKAKQKLLLVDACRSEPRSGAAKSLRTVSLEKLGLASQAPPEGIAALFSCSDGEDSLEDPDLGHGVFFYHVLKGWRGEAANRAGKLTFSSLADYVTDRVPRYVRLHFRDTTQIPSYKVEGKGSWVLPTPGKAGPPRRIRNSIGMELALIPAGKFTMGSPRTEKGRSLEEVEHEVHITRPFYMGAYEVTQAEYQRVLKDNPSWFSRTGPGKAEVKGTDTGRFPVENVSWHDAQKFCRWLSLLAKEKAAHRLYRLPTEAEWEYACRGGARSATAFHFGESLSSQHANFDGNGPYGTVARGPYLKRTAPVGSYKPNAFGLYDMHGNVYEWCADGYARDYYENSPSKDPQGASKDTRRLLRGGSWYAYAVYCRSAARYSLSPDQHNFTLGFRVVCAVEGKEE
jgi:formylglycine-generating enzyme required for sulfatase activity